MKLMLKVAALVAVLAMTSACNPVFHATQSDLDALRSELAGADQSAADSEAAAQAQMAAQQAQAAAEAALEAIREVQGELDATNQRIERMFEESQAK